MPSRKLRREQQVKRIRDGRDRSDIVEIDNDGTTTRTLSTKVAQETAQEKPKPDK